jgi:hypothetical protein
VLHIFTSNRFVPEKKYVFHVLLEILLELNWQAHFSEKPTTDAHGHPVTRIRLPNGRDILIEDHFFEHFQEGNYLKVENIPATIASAPHPFLQDASLHFIFGRPHYTFGEGFIQCGGDLFGSAFFMLTRWEEYANPTRDTHGRFPGSAALSVRTHFIRQPVVNEYAALLSAFFQKAGWQPPPLRRRFRVVPTCDVDTPLLWWSGADRFRTLAGSLVRRGDVSEFWYWLRGPIWQKKDPNDTFDDLMQQAEQRGEVFHFNFLGHRVPSSDCYYPVEHPFVRALAQKMIQRGHIVGFHPSYESFEQPALFARELESLRQLTPELAQSQGHWTSGRQHYLRFAAPFTWQLWADHGMQWDSTLGYSDEEGFRCGICVPFPVFNFLTRQMLPLRERPLIAMDVTLALYKKYTPSHASDVLAQLRRTVQEHAGEWVWLWHNSSLNAPGWEDWKAVFKAI